MAAGAGSLNVRLGGPAVYHGALEDRPTLGTGAHATAAHVVAALSLVTRTLALWLALLVASAALVMAAHHV
jgi:adenosylcobinamide-phosphate synthase